MRQLLLTAALGLCACTESFHSVGFYDRIDTMNAGGRFIQLLGSGDFTGDGRADVVLIDNANNANQVSVLFSKGDGNFSAAVSYPLLDNNSQTHSLVVGDLNGDGRADVVVGSIEQNTVSMFINQGDGRLVALQPATQSVNCRPSYLALYDMTADGKPDLVVGCGANSVSELHILKNQGPGPTPGQPLSFGGLYTHKWTLATGQNGQDPTAQGIAVGEFNGDGMPDIAVATNVDLRILNSPKEGSTDYLVSVPLSTATSAIALGDINGNGTPDIAALQDGKSVAVFEYATGGAYNQVVAYQNIGVTGRTQSQTLKVADLSSDGKSDILLTLQNPSEYELKFTVSRGETGAVPSPVTLSYKYPASELQLPDNGVSLGDVNGDGKPDLLLRNGAKISVLLNASR